MSQRWCLSSSRLKHYIKTICRISMVIVQCHHCKGDVEFDDDADGEYSCPHCDGLLYTCNQEIKYSDFMIKLKIQIFIFFFVIIFFGVLLLLGGKSCTGTGCGG